MLEAKEEVVEYCYEGQDDLGYVEAIWHGKTSACHRENSSEKIQKNVEYGPSFRAFPFEIPVGWRGVLDEGYDQFPVAQTCEGIPVLVVVDHFKYVQKGCHNLNGPKGYDNDDGRVGYSVQASLITMLGT